MKTTPDREEKVKLFHEKEAFKYNLIAKLKEHNLPSEDISICVDYYCFNYSLKSIMRRKGCTTQSLWQLIDKANKILMHVAEDAVIIDEMTIEGESYKRLYVPIGSCEVVGRV